METIDLHLHSAYSDGSFECAQIAAEAERAGVGLISLTDHDNIDGLHEMSAEARRRSIAYLTGVELEGMITSSAEAHILAYGFDPDSGALRNHLKTVSESRARRNAKILGRLSELHIDIEDKLPHTNLSRLARTHFASALIEKGHASNMDDAFRKYLGRSGRAHFSSERPDAETLIALIKRSGGLSVLAHPFKLRMDAPKAIEKLANLGLDGVEAYYPTHTPSQTQSLKQLAKRFGLKISCGSDFHGAYRSSVEIACCFESDPALEFWRGLAII